MAPLNRNGSFERRPHLKNDPADHDQAIKSRMRGFARTTVATGRGRIERHIKPLLGRKRTGEVKISEVPPRASSRVCLTSSLPLDVRFAGRVLRPAYPPIGPVLSATFQGRRLSAS